MAVMKASEFVAKLKDVAQNYKTLYVMGCFGAPLTGGNVSRYCNNHAYNKQAARTKMIKAAANQNPPVFGFDCVCLIKGILWGWRGDASKTYGGASYAVNGVPDIGADTMITKCKGVSTNFSNVEVGEALWCSGHIGVYIGGGLAVECSPAFENDVQITAVKNMGTKSGYNARTWTKHGKLPYIEYDNAAPVQPDKPDTGAGAGGAIKAGSVVRVKQGAKTYTGGGLASFVYERDHVVSELNGDRAVITYGGVTVAAVRVSDLVLADGSGAGGTIKAGSVVRVMDNMVIVLVVVAVVAVVFVGLIVLIPYLVKKGINVSGVLTGTTTVLDTADHVVDTLKEFFPEVPVITVIDKVIGWAQKATEAAEQLYKTSKIEEGQRKEEATKLVYQFIEAAGIEIDDDLKKIVDGAIEAAVFALPKTHTDTAEALNT